MNDASNGPIDSLVTAILHASDSSLQMGFPPRPQIHVFDSSRIEEYEGLRRRFRRVPAVSPRWGRLGSDHRLGHHCVRPEVNSDTDGLGGV